MVSAPLAEVVVLDTKWFQVVARRPLAYAEPHYSLRTRDYVGIVAVTTNRDLLLVRQFRPAVWETTLELPSGHVEPSQTPEQAARTELLEETGHEAERFELVGDFSPDTGRLGNRMWCFFAGEAHPTAQSTYQPEAGIELVQYRGRISDLLREKGFYSALNSAALFAAVLKGKLKI
jgi:ADP-ribose pyrophosphatase